MLKGSGILAQIQESNSKYTGAFTKEIFMDFLASLQVTKKPRQFTVFTGFLGMISFEIQLFLNDCFKEDLVDYWETHWIRSARNSKFIYIDLFKKHGPWKLKVIPLDCTDEDAPDYDVTLLYGTTSKLKCNSIRECLMYIIENES